MMMKEKTTTMLFGVPRDVGGERQEGGSGILSSSSFLGPVYFLFRQ